MPERVGQLFAYTPDLAERYTSQEELDLLLAKLRRPAWYRAAIVMAYGLGTDHYIYSIDEIAQVLGRSPVTVKKRLTASVVGNALRRADLFVRQQRRRARQ